MSYVSRDTVVLSALSLVAADEPQLIYDITTPATPTLVTALPNPTGSTSGVQAGKYAVIDLSVQGETVVVSGEATLNNGLYTKTSTLTARITRAATSGFSGEGVLDTTWAAIKAKIVADLTTAKSLTSTPATVSKYTVGYMLT